MRTAERETSFAKVTHYRCTACGNRTRFDVLSTRRARVFEHYNLAGECTIEEEDVLSLVIESVTCRWCGRSNAIETIEESGSDVGKQSSDTESPNQKSATGGS